MKWNRGILHIFWNAAMDLFYTGWTNNLERRVKAHNAGKGAKYTKSRKPVKLVYFETFLTKQEAMRREWEIKQLSRVEKWKLIQAKKQ